MARKAQAEWSWFYSAPIEDVAIRRGDPLGMRAIAEKLAEQLAPGLSNGTRDARWLTILSWCLEQGYAAWHAYEDDRSDGLTTRAATRGLYAWIRPLEALWIARTVVATDDAGKGRQLPGVQSVRRWGRDRRHVERFGFSEDSYTRYRFTGSYGSYRGALRSLPGLTKNGDGWHLGPAGRELAAIAAKHVGEPKSHRRGKGPRPAPESYWLSEFAWEFPGRTKFLPTLLAEPGKLPSAERRVLRRALFEPKEDRGEADAERRLVVATVAGESSATTREGLFRDIAGVLGNSEPDLTLLPDFCVLGDAGIAAMNAVWHALKQPGLDGGRVRLGDVVCNAEVSSALDELAAASARWLRAGDRSGDRWRVPGALASAITAAGPKPDRRLRALELHHRKFGGGRAWVRIEKQEVTPLSPLRGGQTGQYRFRVAALSRLAVQCGVIDEMPAPYGDFDDDDEEAGE